MTLALARRSIPLGLSVLSTLLVLGCGRRSGTVTNDCMAAPAGRMLPRIRFAEPTTPGTITAMLLDAHGGQPIQNGLIVVVGSSPTLGAFSDSTGRATLQRVPVGRHILESRVIGYAIRQDTIIVDSTAGRALIIQLRSVAGVMC